MSIMVDLAVIILIGIFTIVGLKRGFAREVIDFVIALLLIPICIVLMIPISGIIVNTTKIDKKEVNYTQNDLSVVLREAVKDMMNIIKTKIDVINDGRGYETVIVGGGGELPLLDQVASQTLGSPARCYMPETIGARDMTYVPALGMLYFLSDRKELLGESVSLTLPDISSTMSVRLKGFTKTKTENDKKSKLKRALESLFTE